MININGAITPQKRIHDLILPSSKSKTIDATGLMIFPGLIDPHVHFRTPGMEYKEDWLTAARASIQGGYTTVFDMPNTIPPTFSLELLHEKKALIDSQLQQVGIPLRYQLYFGADKAHFSEIHRVKDQVVGIKVFMGCSTGNLVVDDDESLHSVFAIAATQNLLVAVHAEDEAMIKAQRALFPNTKKYEDHSKIRNADVASCAVKKAIELAKIYGVRLYILHVSTEAEINLIADAKNQGIDVFAETTPHHLFLNDHAYGHLHGNAVVNPPLRASSDQEALWRAVTNGTIDTIGSDHAPHLPHEKAKPYGECPSGMPGIETTLPLLLTAAKEGLISIERIIELTCKKPREIFHVPENDDFVLVDTEQAKVIDASKLKTKCAWSAFNGKELVGWPKYIYINGEFFEL